MKYLSVLFAVVSGMATVAMAYPYPYPVAIALPDLHAPVHVPAPHSPHKGYEEALGRVKMQVYRGPTEKKGYDYFAPWGYYETQPADFKKKGYH